MMTNKALYFFLLIFSVFISTVAQILFKFSANKKHPNIIKEYFNRYIITGYLLFFISTILTVISLKFIELKYSPIIQSLGYIFIIFLAKVFLDEVVTRNKVIGVILIFIGIIVFSK